MTTPIGVAAATADDVATDSGRPRWIVRHGGCVGATSDKRMAELADDPLEPGKGRERR
ncbi:hypothetical protein IU459_15055 [Nocardia amamiensis]|uniref:Uncharacterized protein n=1 Tax=Nocardia amamiensis TaxID=404578 RepID=A0ABS0CQI2_9NOCA|nr:hypothetical protein [Nocardia amamiensis]MBF6298852.1 hypothetical protein [Nocardia amamiensis]